MPLDDELLALLTLSLVPGLGPKRLRLLRAHHGSAHAAVAAARPGWGPILPRCDAAALAAAVDPSAGAREAERVARVGGWCIGDDDPRYPRHWAAFDELPPLLYVRGRWPEGLAGWPPAAVAVVGSRRADAAATAFAFDLGRHLARSGAVVVSGLAYGIDAAAHRGALAAGAGATVAVVAGGIDRPGPSGNAPLARAIVEAGGALLSEAPVGFEPGRGDFPRRNRLVAALARAVVVVAAGRTSGAHLTAGHALGYGRDVLVCPARPWDDDLAGNLSLLRDGAMPLCSVDEAPGLLGLSAPAASELPVAANGGAERAAAASGGAERGTAHAVSHAVDPRVPEGLEWVYRALRAAPTPLDALLERTGRGVRDTLAGLERLVASGVCDVDGARRYRRLGPP
jgi:DNA processing protein